MRQRGYVLLENLIALLLLAFGMLGIIALQARAISANTQSQQRMQASLYSSELAGMAAADPLNLSCYAVNASPPAACSSAKAATLAGQWHDSVKSTLPNGEVSTTVAADGVFSITLRWRRVQEDTTHNYVLSTRIAE